MAIETRDITPSKQRPTKAMIRLCGCAGRSAPLLFAYDRKHIFSWPSSYVVGTNEYPQHTFLWRIDENYPSIIIKYPPYLFFCMVQYGQTVKTLIRHGLICVFAGHTCYFVGLTVP